MRSGSSKIRTLVILSAFSAMRLFYNGQPPDTLPGIHQDCDTNTENICRITTHYYICTECSRLSTAPNQIPIWFKPNYTKITNCCKYIFPPRKNTPAPQGFIQITIIFNLNLNRMIQIKANQ